MASPITVPLIDEPDQSPTLTHEALTPPERVRFAAPLSLQAEGSERSTEGAVVNLSVQGSTGLPLAV